MRTFWTLVGYEYRKIFRRRATWAALALGLVFLVVTSQISLFGGYYLDGEFVETNRQRLSADRAFAAALSGRPLDDALFDTAAAAFAAIPADAPLYQATEEYNEIARPYEPVWETLGFFFSSEELRAETTGWGQAFYSQRKAWMAERIGAIQASEATRAALRSAFPVVVGATVLLLVPMMFDLDPTSAPLWPLLALNLLPSRMMKFENIFSPAPYDFFGTVLPQYIVFPAAAILFSLPLAALAMRAYRRHQG